MSSVVIGPSAVLPPSTVAPAAPAPTPTRAASIPAPPVVTPPAAEAPTLSPPQVIIATTARPAVANPEASSSRLPALLPLPTPSQTSLAAPAPTAPPSVPAPASPSGFIIATSTAPLSLASGNPLLPSPARDPTLPSTGMSASIPEPSFAPGKQGIPESDPTASTSAASRQAAGSRTNLPVAAVAVIGVVGGLIGIFLAYRFYVWWYRRQRDEKNATPYPEMRGVGDRRTMLHGSASTLNMGYATEGKYQSGVTLGDAASWNKQESVRGDAWDRNGHYGANVERGYESNSGSNTPVSAGPAHPPRSHSPFGLYAHDGSASGSKGSLPSHPSRNSMSSASHLNSAGHASGSRRSLYSGSDHYTGPKLSNKHSSSRLNGAPHHASNRIDIIPPLPLAPPPGAVVSTDKSTLDFSPLAGIGGKESWFGGADKEEEEVRRRSATALSRVAVPIHPTQARSQGSHHGSIVSKLSTRKNAGDSSVHSSPLSSSSRSSPRQHSSPTTPHNSSPTRN